MPTNKKEYMLKYMSKYNLTDKCKEYKKSYYEKNKEKIKQQQREYYHKYKYDPSKSHFLEKRLKLQREAYSKKRLFVTPYKHSVKFYSKKIPFKINRGSFLISFK